MDLVPDIVPDEAQSAQNAFEAAAARTKRSVVKPGSENPINANRIPRVTDDASLAKVKPGTKSIDPEGNERYKPIESDADIDALPEGAEFADPEGNIRQKPVYQSLGFTAEMLHDMSVTKDAKRQSLEMFYPGQVHEIGNSGEFEVVEEGPEGTTYRKPGKTGQNWGAFAGKTAAEAAPLLGMTGGAALGGVGGAAAGTAVVPGAGTLAGGAAGGYAGMVGGAMLGRQFNNVILSLAGVHQDLGAQLKSVGWEGLGAAGGEVVGKGIAAIPGVIGASKKAATGVAEGMQTKLGGLKENLSDALEAFGITPEKARYFLGTTPETAQRGADIATRAKDMGIKESVVGPSVIAPEAPMIGMIEQFDAKFRAQNVLAQGAQKYYEKSSTDLLAHPDINVNVDTPLTAAEKKVSSYKAGRAALDRARLTMAQEDATLENARRDVQGLAADMSNRAKADRQSKLDILVQTHQRNKEAADNFVQAGLKELQSYANDVLKIVKADENPGNAWREVGDAFKAYNTATRLRAKKLYNDSYAAGADFKYDTEPLADDAREFLQRIPETVRSKYPEDIRRIAKLGGVEADEAAGVAAVEPQQLDLAELHQIRSWLRHGIDYADLTPDMRSGSLKFFEQKVNALIHDAKLPDELESAVQMLDSADAFYKKNIPFLNDQMVTTVMDGLRAGVPPNPAVLADLLFDPTRVEAMREARKIVGEPLWKTVEAAHLNSMIDKSLMLEPGTINAKKFADQVESLVQNRLLETGYSKPVAEQALRIARDISRKLEGTLPVKVEEGDTLSTLMRKVERSAAEVKQFAEHDPVKALAQEARKIDKEFAQAAKLAKEQRRSNPLHFLYEDSMSELAIKAADKILAHEDTIMASAATFGRDSTEFKLLQQVYVHRFFQRALGQTGKMRAELGSEKGMTEELQALMFPGITRNTMLQLVKDMEFLFSTSGSDVGGSMAAATRVTNPWQSIPLPQMGGVSGMIIKLPGMTAVGRFTLGKLFATVIDGMAHPNFLNWLAGNLRKGAEERFVARQVLQDRLKLGGWVGALTGMKITEPDTRK